MPAQRNIEPSTTNDAAGLSHHRPTLIEVTPDSPISSQRMFIPFLVSRCLPFLLLAPRPAVQVRTRRSAFHLFHPIEQKSHAATIVGESSRTRF